MYIHKHTSILLYIDSFFDRKKEVDEIVMRLIEEGEEEKEKKEQSTSKPAASSQSTSNGKQNSIKEESSGSELDAVNKIYTLIQWHLSEIYEVNMTLIFFKSDPLNALIFKDFSAVILLVILKKTRILILRSLSNIFLIRTDRDLILYAVFCF